jgi:hypothetical protein
MTAELILRSDKTSNLTNAELDGNLLALATDFAGDDDPSASAKAYSKWADTLNALVKQRNADNSDWVEIAPLLKRLLAVDEIVGADVSTPLNVVAYGSNSNGYWVQFAGGLQVCWLHGSSNWAVGVVYSTLYVGPHNWTFPAAFVTAPAVYIGAKWPGSASWVGAIDPGLTSTSFTMVDVSSRSTDTCIFNGVAIGLWK